MAECSVTFSRFKAIADLPQFGIAQGVWYWVSDQTIPDDATGLPVFLLGFVFLQPADEDDGVMRPRFAGNAYLTYRDCEMLGTGVVTCEKGACTLNDECCYITFENLCAGDFAGENTICDPALPACFGIGACCGALLSDCFNSYQNICDQFDGHFLPGTTCEDSPAPCIGACCIWELNVGLGCLDGYSPTACAQLPGSEGGPNITHSVWQGPDTTCIGTDCPGEGACCTPAPAGAFVCAITTPDDCPAEPGGYYRGLATNCTDSGICGGACCEFDPLAMTGTCFDVLVPGDECFQINRTFLGPGTSCDDNAGDCGVCCLVDPADGTIFCDPNLLQEDCLALGGTPFGPGAQCEICDTVTRACCILDDPDADPPCDTGQWTCVDVQSQAECNLLGGIFRHDRSCQQVPCIIVGGACCCPADICPLPPCPAPQPGNNCTCTPTIKEDCPTACIWVGPGRGCTTPVPAPFPPFRPSCETDCEMHCPPGKPEP